MTDTQRDVEECYKLINSIKGEMKDASASHRAAQSPSIKQVRELVAYDLNTQHVDSSVAEARSEVQKADVKQEQEAPRQAESYADAPRYVSPFEVYDNEEIIIELEDAKQSLSVLYGISAYELFKDQPDVVAVYSNNELLSLNERLDISCTVRAVRKGDPHAAYILNDTLRLLVHMASCVAFPGLSLHYRYDLGNALYFYYPEMACSRDDIRRIEDALRGIIDANLLIQRDTMSFLDAVQRFTQLGQHQSVELLHTLNKSTVDVVSVFGGAHDYVAMWIYPLLRSSAEISGCYAFMPFDQGFLVHFGQFCAPELDFSFADERLRHYIAQIKNLHLQQAELIGFRSVASLNKLSAQTRVLKQIIAIAEFNHERQIAEVAERATHTTRAIFVAGPSSSGKTTFANRLSCHLRGRNFEPIRISLDDFYAGADKAPRIPGTDKPDFEHLHSLDVYLIQNCLRGLVSGQEVTMPVYDFKTACPDPAKAYKLKLSRTGILVVEGIHALNDEITSVVYEDARLRVFIQPIGTLAWDEIRTIEHRDIRLIRRMCRDFISRGRTADQTLTSWESVLQGEQTWILPRQADADVYFNSGIMYEMFVLRVSAVPLLRQVPHESRNYSMAQRLLRMLSPLLPVQADLVPENSLLCEFLPGGSQYEDFFF